MLESDLIKSTSSWPFVEIRKLLKERKNIPIKPIRLQAIRNWSQLPWIWARIWNSQARLT